SELMLVARPMMSTTPMANTRELAWIRWMSALPSPGRAIGVIWGSIILVNFWNPLYPRLSAASCCPFSIARYAGLITSDIYAPLYIVRQTVAAVTALIWLTSKPDIWSSTGIPKRNSNSCSRMGMLLVDDIYRPVMKLKIGRASCRERGRVKEGYGSIIEIDKKLK